VNDFSQVESDGEQLVVKVHQNYEAKMHARVTFQNEWLYAHHLVTLRLN
jgi:nucleoid-associated protein YejK